MANGETTKAGEMRVDWFHRTESTKFYNERPAQAFQVVVAKGASLAEILAAGYAAGLPKGSARGGCFELQTDDGIWSSPTGGRMNPKTAIFKTWDELDAEEA
jgi:hypothetical protein